MRLILENLTANPLSYLSGTITVPANNTFEVLSIAQQTSLALDGQLRQDILKNRISILDGTNTFAALNALNQLTKIYDTLNLNNTNGDIAALNEEVILYIGSASVSTIAISGTWSGTLVVEATNDISAINFNTQLTPYPIPTGGPVTEVVSNGSFLIFTGGWTAIRVRANTWTSGTASIILNSSSGTNVTAGSQIASQGAPNTYENAWPVLLGQQLDLNNTNTINSANASPGSPWIGAWTQTRDIGFVKQLCLLTSNVSLGLGGIFTLEYSEDGGATVVSSNPRPIGNFSAIRDFDFINTGSHFRVKFEPDRTMDPGEFIEVRSIQRRQNDGPFARLVNQVLEEQNTSVQHLASFLKAFDAQTGQSVNIRPTKNEALRVSDDKTYRTPSGSTFTEGIRNDIEFDFGAQKGAENITKLLDYGLNGTISHDSTLGQVEFHTGASSGNVAFFLSDKPSIYEAAKGLRSDQTVFLSRLPIGTEKVEWGWCVLPSSGNDFLHGVGYGADATGVYVFIKNNGTYTNKVYQNSWNRDKCDSSSISLFKINNSPVSLDITKNNLYFSQFEWLGTYPPEFLIATPDGTGPLGTHVIEYPNQNTQPTLPQAQLHMFIRAITDGTDLVAYSGSWRGGAFTNKIVLNGRNPDNEYIDLRVQGKLSNNSSNSPLDAGVVYRGDWYEWEPHYLKIIAKTRSDVSGTLYVDFSEAVSPTNGIDDDIHRYTAFTYTPDDGIHVAHLPLVSRWVRIRYINGIAAQSEFNIAAVLTTSDPGVPLQELDELPTLDRHAGVVRSVITTKNAAGDELQDWPIATDGSPKTYVSHIEDDILIEPLSSGLASQIVVGTTPIRIDPTQISNRRAVRFSNEGPSKIAWGHSSGITFNSASIRMKINKTEHILADSSMQFWAVAENTGGVQNTLNRLPSSASGTATNPSNVLASDDTYANITAASQTITATGFTAGTANALVSVKLGIEGNKQSGTNETVTFQDVVTGNSISSGTVSTGSNVTAVTNHFYIAAISRESNININSVSGLGLGWTQLLKQNSDDNNRAVDIWYAQGTPTGDGIVTASFTSSTSGAHISVSRYSNVSTSNPIEDHTGNNASNSTPIAGPINVTDKGMIFMAAVIDNATSFTPAGGYTTVSAEFSSDSLGTLRKAITSTGTDTPSATLNANKHWGAIAVSLTPAVGNNPIMNLSYTLSAIPGATSENITFTSSLDTSFTVDITSDESWVPADIANINVIATGQSLSAAAANIDTIYLEIVDTTGNTSRISFWQGGKPIG